MMRRTFVAGAFACVVAGVVGGAYVARLARGDVIGASVVHGVEMRGFAYDPAHVVVVVGDTVVWTNADVVPHTATATDTTWTTGEVRAGERGTFVAAESGDYDYFCIYHPSMTGRITVREAAAEG